MAVKLKRLRKSLLTLGTLAVFAFLGLGVQSSSVQVREERRAGIEQVWEARTPVAAPAVLPAAPYPWAAFAAACCQIHENAVQPGVPPFPSIALRVTVYIRKTQVSHQSSEEALFLS